MYASPGSGHSSPPDRMIMSCPPETFTSSAEELYSNTSHLPEPFSEASDATPPPRRPPPSFVPYPTTPREHPERPGETESEYFEGASQRGDSDTIEEEEPDEDRPTDKFGFFTENIQQISRPRNLSQLRRRERKWLHMFDNWKHFMDEDFDKVRSRCRKGIPPALRSRAWKFLSGAAFQMDISKNKHVFAFCERQPGDPRIVEEIEKDLDRQFPQHELFARTGKYGEGGKEDLLSILKAYTILHPEEGYCQGQAPIASVLLMHMPVREAFYVFMQICHKYLQGYYSPGLEAVQLDGDILMQVLKDKAKVTYRHLRKYGVDAPLFMIEWFMCLYCRTLPWPTVLRIWDMFFCEGVKVIFKVAVVLLRGSIGTASQCKQFSEMHGTLQRLRNLPPELTQEEVLVKKVLELDLDDGELERLHFRAVKLRTTKNLKVTM